MKLYGDYHTHTVYSHGKGTVLQNAAAARDKGLIAIGISDHGFAHPFFGLRRDKLTALRNDCKSAEDKTGVRVLMGVESNIVSSRGECDLRPDDYDKFDVFLAGAHVCVKYRDIKAMWNTAVAGPIGNSIGARPSERLKGYFTDTYIKAITTQPIDVITHLDYRVFCDVKSVAHCCREYGTYVEINTKKSHMTDEQWLEVYNTGVNFVIGSDAHSPDRVSDAAPAFELIKRLGFDLSRVHNVDRLPDFRFAKYKGVKL